MVLSNLHLRMQFLRPTPFATGYIDVVCLLFSICAEKEITTYTYRAHILSQKCGDTT